MLPRLKKWFVGSPLRSVDLPHQRLTKKAALAVFASDALSSSAYATEEILLALVIAGTAMVHLSIPVPANPNRMVLAAVKYAKSISQDAIAVHVNADAQDRTEIQTAWKKFVSDVPLVILESPYRAVLPLLLKFIDEIEDARKDDELTIVLPEFVTERWWHQLLHNQTSLLLKGVLLFRPGLVVTSVPYHLRNGRAEARARPAQPIESSHAPPIPSGAPQSTD